MPHGLEYIVRPYQAPGPQGAGLIPKTPKGTRERPIVTWKGKGKLPETKTTDPSFIVNVCHETVSELDRENQPMRVMGSDGESYIDVDRVRKMKLSKTEKKNDSLSQTSSTTTKIDSSLDSQSDNFGSGADDESNKKCAVEWSFKPKV
jgi:hypothetical protein